MYLEKRRCPFNGVKRYKSYKGVFFSRDQSLCSLNVGVLSMELRDTKVIRAFFSVGTEVCVP